MRLDDLFHHAVKEKASDLHLVVNLPPIIRVNGNLLHVGEKPISDKEMQTLILGILEERQKQIFMEEKELDISYEVLKLARFRVNLHWERGNMGLAARIISDSIPTLEDLLMPQVVADLTKLQQGLILMTGPTGCGKSTTLASMIERINNESSKNIITLEDPIEFIFHPKKSIIRQRQLNTDMLSFGAALKHILRKYPDVFIAG